MITKEQIKDIGWALSVLRGLQDLAATDAGPRLASAEAGLKALVMKPTGLAPYTPMQRAELLISQLPATHEGRNTWLKEYGEGLRMPWLSCSDTTAEVERAAPKAYADACSDRGQQTGHELTPCREAPSGWQCTRNAGHAGPCAAVACAGQQTARNEHGIGERGRHEPNKAYGGSRGGGKRKPHEDDLPDPLGEDTPQPLSFEDDIKSKDW